MPDTIKTLAQLNADFADNIVEAVSPQYIRDLFVSLMVHGEIGSGNKSAITLTAAYQAMDLTLAGAVSRGLTIDTVNKRIADIPVDMKAQIDVEVMFNGANNTTYDFAVFRNGVQENRLTASDRLVSATMIGGVTISAAIQLSAGDVLDLRAKGPSSVTFTLLRALLRVRRIAIE